MYNTMKNLLKISLVVLLLTASFAFADTDADAQIPCQTQSFFKFDDGEDCEPEGTGCILVIGCPSEG